MIFTDVKNDPNWHFESTIYDMYQKRIPVVEILSLLASDSSWSHMATKEQSEQVYALFNKVYGFANILSRREEQQKRYQMKK